MIPFLTAVANSSNRNLYDSIVIVEAGEEDDRKQSPIHEGLLCFHSSCFRAAIKGGFKKDDGVIRLDLEDLDVFDAFKV